jgi:hypothetical protein
LLQGFFKKRKMKALELFSGTGSISKVLRERGWECLTLDANPKAQPDILTDIRQWDFTQFPPGYFDYIHMSPCCTHFSRARTSAKTPRDLEGADSLVKAGLAIIEYFQPKWWTCENPESGLLKTRPFMQGLPYFDVDYCQFGSPFRKRTRFWGNVPLETKLCKWNCPVSDGKRHFNTAQRLWGHGRRGLDREFSQNELFCIPRRLCEAIADHLES